jgi:hypothetical protein
LIALAGVILLDERMPPDVGGMVACVALGLGVQALLTLKMMEKPQADQDVADSSLK